MEERILMVDWRMFEENRKKLFELLKKNSFRYSSNPFTLKSGGTSHLYFDGRQTSLTAEGSALIGELFSTIIAFLSKEAEAIGGLTLGADPLVSSVICYEGMRALNKKNLRLHTGFIVRKEMKYHGAADQVVGGERLADGTKVVICDDVITTGDSMLQAVRVAKKHFVRTKLRSFDVTLALALIDREEIGGRTKILAEVPKVISLFRKSEFVSGKCEPMDFHPRWEGEC